MFIKFWIMHIPCVIFTKFAKFVGCSNLHQLLKFGYNHSKGYGVMGFLS